MSLTNRQFRPDINNQFGVFFTPSLMQSQKRTWAPTHILSTITGPHISRAPAGGASRKRSATASSKKN